MTLKEINKELKQMGYELKKELKNFYFSPLNNNPKFIEPIILGINKVSDLSLYQWKSELAFFKIYGSKIN